jgi:hypothetical protein
LPESKCPAEEMSGGERVRRSRRFAEIAATATPTARIVTAGAPTPRGSRELRRRVHKTTP